MKLGTLNKVLKEMIQGKDIPEWLDSLLTNLNQFIEPVGSALKGRLDFKNNFDCDMNSYTMTHNIELKVSVQKNRAVIGVIPLLAANSVIMTGSGVTRYGNGTVGLVANFSGGAGVSAAVTWVILYG